ncbi:L-serine ammonia-lyase, iron-sulfur-dependent, subunit alpha [uncultured Sphaerochaeta sp.]|uniref:L-cysteine desulfidase family protein n=1 Tax=uncultured Sphaerochaeta sp. TaxID=886478 RepID=UPI002A0A2927|nr:L-serine ammonia-lyase, iron-sulfur-dependent, subunit alpha [uncultured Sphaerochaeta sp.]
MIDKKKYDTYVAILKHELVPALGCTEPIAIAYCSAKAKEVLGCLPEKVKMGCSGNIIKNVMGVTVPNSGGLKGIEVAAVLGIVGGDPSKLLEVLGSVTNEDIEKTKQLLADPSYCSCSLVEGEDNLIIVCEVEGQGHTALVEIKNKHTHITRIEKDGKALFTQESLAEEEAEDLDYNLLNVQDILAFADELKVEDLGMVLENQITFNSEISQEGLKNSWGVNVGRSLLSQNGKLSDVRIKARAAAAAGSDARMSGCALPVVINSGSGNQGITLTMPIVEYAKELKASKELTLKSLALANLIAIHQKQYIGDLSAYCGVVCAATGSACGVAFMQGANYEEISDTITNSICTVGGMVCDGAKPSCAAKISIALEAALNGYSLQGNGGVFKQGEGMVKKDIESTIKSVGKMANVGMHSTDTEILRIMLEK